MFLEFYVFGEWVIGWVREGGRGGGGTKHFISDAFWGGGKFYGRILEYPPPPQYTYFMTGPLIWSRHCASKLRVLSSG